ncbi:Crp/Fnr family transcriptional regulator [Lutimaribacter sp. EGI FJ00015]|uniref:Crp/Fnr family transcriptional regulator n=1 Tax=Lutimaribacter degradans TaxID=2945989 RepID=A0ACC5ZV62_9RHOB|nr:Crp/Fnr family transcriptional regulator [Lutimaribacter sp. EGI FJ00013]MCM2562172.1 Crp/Fnr family transcriptional regulator [Lutimaribacter sp. EGI FJ00013]MCO0613326.1 Crp/Fnr family transcriptional regulator [Lutimaribacter sp. EGI FJ00015]MCO0636301.1 Crp/Fnr family transcriptional regulator [Lutimaribacter sp. EGI FJ00014]
MTWSPDSTPLATLDAPDRARLAALPAQTLSAGAVLFRPGDRVQGYAFVLSGCVDVCLTGASGREMLLYSVEPGQSCIQTTMGLLSDSDYSAEAQATCTTQLVLIPRAMFLDLMNRSAPFRALVFGAFAQRMQTMMTLLEKVAFTRVECRLADRLLLLAGGGSTVRATQSELATQVGTAREVVTRRLDAWARRGLVRTGRGTVEIHDKDALARIASGEM